MGSSIEDILDRGFRIATGGAIGVYQFCIESLINLGLSDSGTIYSPWQNFYGFPVKVRKVTREFKN